MSILLALHACVLGGVVWLVLGLGLRPAVTVAVLIAGVLPLAAGVRGLIAARRYTRQWLAIVMVFYVGIGLAEMTASLGHSVGAMLLLLSAALELLFLLRSLKTLRPEARESAES